MPRSVDDTFHRLLWVTLVAVAFTFTVILTSVFVDIDDLLAKRSSPVLKQQVTEVALTEMPAFTDDFQELPSNEEDTDENESSLRTKRSLESNNYLLRIKSPKIKKILTNRLATLLEELDEEESSKVINTEGVAVNVKEKNIVQPKYYFDETTQIKENLLSNKDTNFDKMKNDIKHDVLHLALHNILLQGIVEHLDLNEVYKRVHELMKSFEVNMDSVAKETHESDFNNSQATELLKIMPHIVYKEEDKFFNELIKCEKLRQQILQIQNLKVKGVKETTNESNMLIKTTIEIINHNNRGNENLNNSNENITGVIKLLYNGKDIRSIDTADLNAVEKGTGQNTQYKQSRRYMKTSNEKIMTEQPNIKESSLNQAITDYLNTHSIKFHNKYNLMAKGSFVSKRLKRQIKIRYLDDRVTTEKSKRRKEKSKHHDDELYVEIETHFDGKGTKGEKKKKMVRSLIDKIQKAINSNVDVFEHGETVQQKQLQIKKRTQNPIDYKDFIIGTNLPVDDVEHRQLNPITKTANVIQPLMNVLDKSGDTWKKLYNGPGFLAASKSLNSAEMRELDIDYNTVMENGIPKRLQKPINTESEDLIKPNEYSDMSNVTLYLKDINGSGFSIGINQYADEPPDKETLKIFTGLENLIQAYHQHYDQAEAISNESEEQVQYDPLVTTNHDIKKRNINKQVKLNKQWLAVDRHIDKEREQKNNNFGFTQSSQLKRAINVKLFSNIKSKTKLNKFINTNAMPTKKIFHNNRRNKRQIDKIRIVASDRYPSTSREDVFLVSRENIFANRAIVKEGEPPEVEIGDRNEDHFDFIAPYSYQMDVPSLSPAYISNTYDVKSFHSGLMSKYPHIFIENISRSKEFLNSPTNTVEEKLYQNVKAENAIGTLSNDKNISSTNVDEIVNAILPSRNNYKVVVKIFPKNSTNTSPGYKEVHTVINKSYDKNGVRYVSSLNVSEVSKFENLNKSKENVGLTKATSNEIEQSQIKLLLELHKERIDQELQHLKMESQKLKEMIGHGNINKNISYLLDTFSQLGFKSSYGNSIVHYSDNSASNTFVTTTSSTLLSKSETTEKPLFTPISKLEYTDELNILKSIKENENITKQILTKLDTHTNTLQLFLQKLIDQNKSIPQSAVSTEKMLTPVATPEYDQVIHPFLEKSHTNFTNTVPFIYAFQHPLTANKEKYPQTVANVIYHGHIHANKVDNSDRKNDFLKSVANNLKSVNINKINYNRGPNGNETKFFIDELENDFKAVSNLNNHIHVLTPINNNSTKT